MVDGEAMWRGCQQPGTGGWPAGRADNRVKCTLFSRGLAAGAKCPLFSRGRGGDAVVTMVPPAEGSGGGGGSREEEDISVRLNLQLSLF